MGMNMRYVFRCLVLVALAFHTASSMANTFREDLEQVDDALKNNPTYALPQSLESCLTQRNHAVTLNKMGMHERARRALDYCFKSLNLKRVEVVRVTAPSQEELEAKANEEYELALTLEPDVSNGLAIYRECAACHEPEGWGLSTGIVPQIAGQHRTVLIKQLADFRAGNRDSVLMAPYATVESIGGAQAVADVAEYISTLEISVENGKGDGDDLELGAKVYAEECAECHGDTGEGFNEDAAPRIQAQHYEYLLRQFRWIRDEKRRNGSKKMTFVAKDIPEREMKAVLDYTSRLQPPEELRAPAGWENPDFN
jgi:cytochrome c553